MVYAMTFSGFYLAIMLVLFGLILRAVSLEFRHRDPGWSAVWDGAFFLGSLVPSLLVGVALGNVIRGVPMDANGDYTGTFFELLNPYSLLVGVTGPGPDHEPRRRLACRQGGRARCTSAPCAGARRSSSPVVLLAVGDVGGHHRHRVARLRQRVRPPARLAVPRPAGRGPRLHPVAAAAAGRRPQGLPRLGGIIVALAGHRRREPVPRHRPGTRHAAGHEPHRDERGVGRA